MSNQRRDSAAPVEPYFDRTPQPFGDGPPDLLVYDASPRTLRQRTVNFAAKRLADMRYASGLGRATAERHFRWRPTVPPGGLGFHAAPHGQAELVAAQRRGNIVVDMDDADRRVIVRWNGADFSEPVVGTAIARPGYGGIVLGPQASLGFDTQPVSRRRPQPGHGWPLGDVVETPPSPPDEIARALDGFFARSAGAYGILIAAPERILCERYNAFGAADRATPSWSMTKAITCTVIGRLIQQGWLASVYDRLRGVSGRRRRVRSGTTLDRRHRARRGIPVHQQRPQRARRDHPRPGRTARAAVLRDLVRSVGRSPRHGELPAFPPTSRAI
jgi:hypothetical protein